MKQKRFYILNTDATFEEVAGETVIIPLFEEFDLFIHKYRNDYRISECKTGNCISYGKSKEEVIENAKKELKHYGKEKIEQMIKEKTVKYGISPRYRKSGRTDALLTFMEGRDGSA